MVKWGIVSTVLAPPAEVLRFVAYHLELGAHRIYIFLDDEIPEAYRPLKAHPKVRVQTCTPEWWRKRKKKRPVKHQPRQTLNATRAYKRVDDVDWLAHIDVDEFMVPTRPVADVLADLPASVDVGRMRPMEQLADGDGTAFKAYLPPGPERNNITNDIFPTYGNYLRGGFVSHSSGKVFIRTGMPDITIRIHKAFRGDDEIVDIRELTQIDLAHCHAPSWTQWYSRYRYRLEKGAYRADLDPGRKEKIGQLSLNALFTFLEQENGEAGLRAFHDEVAADTQYLRDKLDQHGLLRQVDLKLDEALERHFPDEV